jgi:hypothetical protein
VLEVPGVLGCTEEGVVGLRRPSKLWGIGLADHNAARGPEAGDERGVCCCRGSVSVDRCAVGGDETRCVFEILHPNRNTGQWPDGKPGVHPSIECRCVGHRSFGRHGNEGVDGSVQVVDAFERVGDEFL